MRPWSPVTDGGFSITILDPSTGREKRRQRERERGRAYPGLVLFRIYIFFLSRARNWTNGGFNGFLIRFEKFEFEREDRRFFERPILSIHGRMARWRLVRAARERQRPNIGMQISLPSRNGTRRGAPSLSTRPISSLLPETSSDKYKAARCPEVVSSLPIPPLIIYLLVIPNYYARISLISPTR